MSCYAILLLSPRPFSTLDNFAFRAPSQLRGELARQPRRDKRRTRAQAGRRPACGQLCVDVWRLKREYATRHRGHGSRVERRPDAEEQLVRLRGLPSPTPPAAPAKVGRPARCAQRTSFDVSSIFRASLRLATGRREGKITHFALRVWFGFGAIQSPMCDFPFSLRSAAPTGPKTD